MNSEGGSCPPLPDPVREILDEFKSSLDLDVHLWSVAEDGTPTEHIYPQDRSVNSEGRSAQYLASVQWPLTIKGWVPLELEIRSADSAGIEAVSSLLRSNVERVINFLEEVDSFTKELSERWEEINLLYSISETLGSVIDLEKAAKDILTEVCEVLGAERGSLWVHDQRAESLHLTASVDQDGIDSARLQVPDLITSAVFRTGRSHIGSHGDLGKPRVEGAMTDISVPISYSPPLGQPRIVGVIDLFGRVGGDRFTTSDERLLSAIASQVGAALENNRLIQESLEQERMSHEMELAHNLQMKLLKSPEGFEGADVAAHVTSAEQVGGDFFHLFKLPEGRIGIMIGDVSTHGFPAALIMALSMSAANIYALESPDPSEVLRKLDDALRDELESTEMFLSLCYVVIDGQAGNLHYSNAGHPHAFVLRETGEWERLTASDPPVGLAGPDSYGQETVSWGSGDLLLLFTDGLSDTLAAPERSSGELVVLDTVREQATRSSARIVEVLFDLADSATPYVPTDDRTAIVLRT